jgi:tryptophan 2,3-dioxygenase
LSDAEKQSAAGETLKTLLRQHDLNVNVRWRLSHFRSAVRHLDRKPQTIAATGGTNWQQYLPPRHQRVIFFPQLWTEEELIAWGTKVNF